MFAQFGRQSLPFVDRNAAAEQFSLGCRVARMSSRSSGSSSSSGCLGMLVAVRNLFRWLSAILFAAVVVQVALAAFGAFDAVHKADKVSISKKTIENGFGAHAALGTLIVIAMLVLLIVASAGRLGPMQVRWAGGIFALGVIQFALGIVSTSAPVVGLLHGLNALLIFSATGLLAHRTWTRDAAEAAPARAPSAAA
jgi:hypothetical protein